MLNQQQELIISKYLELYDILISRDHVLRQINDLVDFSFVIEEIENNYSESMGRSAENPDGPELKTLIEKTKDNGIKIEEIIGDTAYSGKDNLKYAQEHNIKMISKLHPIISNGSRKKEIQIIIRLGHIILI